MGGYAVRVAMSTQKLSTASHFPMIIISSATIRTASSRVRIRETCVRQSTCIEMVVRVPAKITAIFGARVGHKESHEAAANCSSYFRGLP